MKATYDARKGAAEPMRFKAFEKRTELGMSVREFARYIGVSPTYYLAVENGHKVPSMKMINKIRTAIGGQKNDQ